MRFKFDQLKLDMWVIGPILRKIILARFANTFAMMYGSGISILDCIANSRDVVNNLAVAKSLEDVTHEIESGKNLTQSFQNTGMFPPLVIRMLKVGEATGSLDKALLNVSYFYDRDVKRLHQKSPGHDRTDHDHRAGRIAGLGYAVCAITDLRHHRQGEILMKQSLLLFLSADRLHAQLMAGGKIALQHDFTDTPDGRENFASFLQTAKCPTYLLTDLIEEDFRHEIVPHLTGGSRTALLKRKFDQFYRGTPFHQATLLQRQKTGRRDVDMLFSALTNPSLHHALAEHHAGPADPARGNLFGAADQRAAGQGSSLEPPVADLLGKIFRVAPNLFQRTSPANFPADAGPRRADIP